MQTASGGGLVYNDGKNIERTNYNNWSKLSFVDKMKRRFNIAKHQFNESSSPIINSIGAIFGEYDPENPDLNTGIVYAPSRATPQQIQQSAKLMETINNYWRNLGKLKIRLSGGRATSGILTKPGTAPTTFNGQNINYITSPKGGNVTHKFYTNQGSEYILTKDGFARRVKSPHDNTLGQGSGPTEWNAANSDAGLHNWNEGTTIFTEGEDGKLFNTAFYKLSDFGFKPGTYGLARKGEKARIMLIDPKTKQWRAAMLSDVYPTTVKQGLQADRVMETNYSDVPKLGWHILEKANGGWHPGSPVAFIEGLKQGGKMNILEFLKNGSGIHIKEKNKGKFTSYCGGKVTDECIQKGKNSSNPAIRKRATFAANARKWKHKEGGKAFVNGVSILDSNPDAYKYVKKKLKKHQEGGKTSFWKNIGNWVSKNQDAIKGIANIGSQLYSTIGGTKKAADFSSNYDEATKANIKAMTEQQRAKNKKEAGIQAAQFISYLQQQNPDNHYGELDLQQITQKIADSLYDPQEIVDYQNQRNAEKLKQMQAIQGSAGNSINWLDSLGGILNSNSSNKTPSTSNNTSLLGKTTYLNGTSYKTFNTPTYKSFDNYASANYFKTPGTIDSNGFLNTQLGKMDMNMKFVQNNMPDYSFLLNPSKPK